MSNNSKKNEIKTGVVTFLDVLGWKGIWQRKENAIKTLQDLVKSIKDTIKNKEIGVDLNESTSIEIISDTIVLFTPAELNTVSDKLEWHGELCCKAIPHSIKEGIPLRGATSFGEIVKSNENNIFVGKAVDEAASWHEEVDWIGVFMTPSANYVFNKEESKYWTLYNPPLKENIQLNTFSVKWFNENKTFISELKKDFLQMSPILPEILTKFTNTLKFVENKL